MPTHGEQRHWHRWRSEDKCHSGTRAERWCAYCNKWQPIGAGLNHGLIGWIICPSCSQKWHETEKSTAKSED